MMSSVLRVRNLVWKELTHFVRDRALTPMIIIGPVAELILIGVATSGDIEHLPTAVWNRDPGGRGAALVEMLEASPIFDLDHEISTEDEARDMLKNGQITAAFFIPEDFSRALASPMEARPIKVKLLLDGSDVFAAEAAHFGAKDVVDGFATQVSMGWLGFPSWMVPLETITAARVEHVSPMAYGGWGYRMRPGVRGVIVRGGDSLRLERKDRADLVLTVDDPQSGAGLVNALIQQG